MKIKIDPADRIFSEYIRRRDGKCVRCGKLGTGDKGIIGLQASHFFGRARENTRYDPDNVDALDMGCHMYWGSANHEDYRAFKLKQLGETRFKMLQINANMYKKKDRAMELLKAKALLKAL